MPHLPQSRLHPQARVARVAARSSAAPLRTLITLGATALAIGLGLGAAQRAHAAWEPSKPVEFVVGAGPGGALDQVARTLKNITDHSLLINAAGLEGALAETEVTSADYQTMRALVDADLNNKKAFGFNFLVIEDRVEGGLPSISADIQQCFAFDRNAVGLAVGMEPSTRVDFIPERYSWLSQGVLKAGAVVIDSKGVVEVQSFASD